MNCKQDVFIVGAARTPIGSLLGALSSLDVSTLGANSIKCAMDRANITPDLIDEVFMGVVLQAGAGQNVARQAAIGAGIPIETTATTINMVCGSGLKSIIMAAQTIACGDNEIVVAGGAESMSNAPFYSKSFRRGNKLGDSTLVDGIIADGLTDVFNQYHMGITAENVAQEYGITREMEDEFAVSSQQKAGKAIESGAFDDEISPITIFDRKGNATIISKDEYPRPNTTLDDLSKLRPAFKKDGTVTAGNASGINDGAAAVVLMSAAKVAQLGIKPLAKIVSYASAGVNPEVMGIGPVPAVEKALEKAGLTVEDIDLFEANEAFAAQSIAVARLLNLPVEKVNINGGAIALGHPIGEIGRASCRERV